jgi:hypothetical protein
LSSAAAARPPVRLWKTFRSKLNAIPEDDKTVRLLTGIAFSFRPECCSESQRNGVQLQAGIAFTFDRIPRNPQKPIGGPLFCRVLQSPEDGAVQVAHWRASICMILEAIANSSILIFTLSLITMWLAAQNRSLPTG